MYHMQQYCLSVTVLIHDVLAVTFPFDGVLACWLMGIQVITVSIDSILRLMTIPRIRLKTAITVTFAHS